MQPVTEFPTDYTLYRLMWYHGKELEKKQAKIGKKILESEKYIGPENTRKAPA
jgi:hypothetical protein